MTRAPQSLAVVLAAHGDRGGDGTANATLLSHRDALARDGLFACVAAGVLKGEPSFEAALSEAVASGAEEIAVYPVFMAGGYFATTVLPQRLAAGALPVPVRILPPLGLDPGLPPLMQACALAAAERAGFTARETDLLVVGHGSQGARASAEATETAATALRDFGTFASVRVALLEEPPFVGEVLAASDRPVVAIGFFSGDGLHAGEDVPSLLAGARTPAVYAGSAGILPGIPDLIRRALECPPASQSRAAGSE